jgi:hypothetical protein
MRHYRDGVIALYVFLVAVPAMAQAPVAAPAAGQALVAPPSWAFNDLGCAPALSSSNPPAGAQRVIGSQDTVVKQMMGPGDTLVISGGSNSGLQSGQRYFVRRILKSMAGRTGTELPYSVHTAGWIQILGVDTMLATATIVHACDGIMLDDYLEPFAAPLIAARTLDGNTPQYDNMGHIMIGDQGLQSAGSGQLMTIDRGSSAGVIPGQRFLVFRDKRSERLDTKGKSPALAASTAGLPLVEIGEVLVLFVRAEDSTVQVLGSKDAILTGDLVAPIR